MTIHLRCGHCGKGLKAPEKLAGKAAPCPNCRKPVRVPAAASADDLAMEVLDAEEPEPGGTTPVRPPKARTDEYAVETPPEEPSPEPPDEPAPAAAEEEQSAHRPSPVRPGPSRRRPKPVSASRVPSGGLLYVLFGLTLVPLCVSLLFPHDDLETRLEKTIQSLPESTVLDADGDGEMSDDEFFAVVPGGKIQGAHLSHGSMVHWLYALLAAGGFLGMLFWWFDRGEATAGQVLAVGTYTATFGILFLLIVQWIAAWTQGVLLVGGGIGTIIFWILKFIGFSYRAAMDPGTGFFASFFGFTVGVGFCEEFSKMIPVAMHYRGDGRLNWRGACAWGLASGIGFGVAEGIMYSGDFYNGVATGGTYLVRFVSCVGLHSVWSAAGAIMIWRRRDWFTGDWEWGDMLATMVWVLGVPILLHGLYDTALKKEMNFLALAAAVASFAWLVFITEWTRSQE